MTMEWSVSKVTKIRLFDMMHGIVDTRKKKQTDMNSHAINDQKQHRKFQTETETIRRHNLVRVHVYQ